MMRRLTNGVELFGRWRFFWFKGKNWRTKPQPYFFHRKYLDGTRTLQIMKFEFWSYGSWKGC